MSDFSKSYLSDYLSHIIIWMLVVYRLIKSDNIRKNYAQKKEFSFDKKAL